MSISQRQQVKIEVKREGLPIEKADRKPLNPFNIMELEVVRPEGFELPTFGFEIQRNNPVWP